MHQYDNLPGKGRSFEERKSWYSPVADAYNRMRPGYSSRIVELVAKLAQIPHRGKILEIGCGSGQATVEFAKLGYQITALEPSDATCQIARQNCANYPQVKVENSTFEEWKLIDGSFDAVVAATSFHWIDANIRYQKTAAALTANGGLILLWNAPFQAQTRINRVLDEVYQIYAPSLERYDSKEIHLQNLHALGESVILSGMFKNLQTGEEIFERTYSVDNYLLFLSTLSPYLQLDHRTRDSLFAGLKQKIEDNFAGQIQQSFLQLFQVAQRV